jgi:hypothetical protein
MARDSQLAGDRVQSEYYLQFAEHYFRVLSENRARFEEQNPRRQRDDEDEDEGDEEMVEAGEETSSDERPQQRPDRGERFNRDRRPRRDDREERSNREADGREAAQANGGGETIPFDVLPPAIGRDDSETAETAEEEPRRPRRRTPTPRTAEGDDEVVPAA